MEPVTHILTGACLARTGFNRRAAYATLAMVIAAEFPDVDTLWSIAGPVASFQHHRGITHTFLGLPFEAALIVGVIYGIHRWRVKHASITKNLTDAPVRWNLLYGFVSLALLSHLLLDFTNNYGIRPFFPFNPRWYAESIVFIFDPLLFLFLVTALVAPWLFGLIGAEVGAKRQCFRGRGWAIAALVGVVSLWTVRWVQHKRATEVVMAQSAARNTQYPLEKSTCTADADCTPPPDSPVTYLSPQRALLSPDPLSIFRWYSVSDYGTFYQLGAVDSGSGTYTAQQSAEPKLNADATMKAAMASRLGRAYLDWSPMPFLSVSGAMEDASSSATRSSGRIVTFQDPRFMGDAPLLHTSGRTPLTGTVELDEDNRVIRETLNGKAQR